MGARVTRPVNQYDKRCRPGAGVTITYLKKNMIDDITTRTVEFTDLVYNTTRINELSTFMQHVGTDGVEYSMGHQVFNVLMYRPYTGTFTETVDRLLGHAHADLSRAVKDPAFSIVHQYGLDDREKAEIIGALKKLSLAVFKAELDDEDVWFCETDKEFCL